MMGVFYDITGRRYGRLTVVRLTPNKKYGKHVWECLCDCGATTLLVKRALQSGNTQSCGCLIGDTARTHGKSGTDLYRTWSGILTRCTNPAAPQYPHYGGRGITVCPRWSEENGFIHFFMDMGEKPGASYSIERQDNNGPYSPDNCKWATPTEQSNNQRTNRVFTIAGETKTLMQWVRSQGIPYDRVWHRLKAGWEPARALEMQP
jgi:hypothetical protein